MILMAPGRSAASERAAWFHTGSHTSDEAVVDAACRAAGVYRVYTPTQLGELASALHSGVRPVGRRVGLITTGGGNGVLAADYLSRSGLDVVSFSPNLTGMLEQLAPETPNPGNPLDQVGAVLEDARVMVDMADAMLSSGEVDAVVLTGSPLANWWGYNEELERLEIEAGPMLKEVGDRLARPVIMHADQLHFPAVKHAMEAGLPTYRDIEEIGYIMGRLNDDLESPPEGVPVLPKPAEPYAASTDASSVANFLAESGIAIGDRSVKADLELVLGCYQESRFGPVAFARLGGPWAAAFNDTQASLAPLDESAALRLLRRLKALAARSQATAKDAAGIRRAAALLTVVSRLCAAHPELGQIVLEPVALADGDAVVVDVRIVDGATWKNTCNSNPER